jgi:hypothetical protein
MQQFISADSTMGAAHRDRRFFTLAAIALTLIFVAGFSWSSFVRTRPGATAFGGPNLLPLVRWHAAASASWMLFLVLQTALVATRGTNIHRRLGVAGGLLAASVVVFGWLVTFHAHPLSTVRPVTFRPKAHSIAFTAIPSEELFVFTLLTGCGLYLRRRSAAHKRLMLLGTLCLITAGTTRLPLPPVLLVMAWFGVPEAIVVALLMRHDVLTRRRIHSATIWGGALVVVGAVARFWIAHTDIWFAIAH